MKVLFVATVMVHLKSFHLPYMKWFQEQGWEVHLCANNDMELPYCDKKYIIPIERSPFKLNNIKAYRELVEIIKSNHYDIIHCHTPMGGVLARLAAKQVRESHTKVIYTAHGFHFYKGAPLMNWLIYYPIERLLSRYTDVLITINNEDYIRAQRFQARKVVLVPGVGINTDKFIAENPNKRHKKSELNITDEHIVLLSVGELIKRKNHEIVIRALSKLRNPQIKYFICGTGPLCDYLQELAMQLNVAEQVVFLGYRQDISEICSVADVFVFPSIQEGLPVALMEAMATGLPVVCSNIRGNTDLVQEREGAFLCQPTDLNSFANAIASIISDSKLRSMMGNINRENIKQYDIVNVLKIMENIYAEETEAKANQ